MSVRSLEQATSLLGDLSGTELEQLSAKVAALRALGSQAAAPSTRPGHGGAAVAVSSEDAAFLGLLFRALGEALQHDTGASCPAFHAFAPTRAGKAFTKAAEGAAKLHASWFPKATRMQTMLLCRVYARAVLNFLAAQQRPLGWLSIAAVVGNLSQAVDASFPGYAKAGLLSMLLVAYEARVEERSPTAALAGSARG